MKTRNGFVSNSSSSSFIIDASKHSEDEVRTYVQKLLDASNFLHKTEQTVDDICSIYTENSIDSFVNSLEEFYGKYRDGKPKHLADFKGEIVRVNSTSDNSIPWDIQDSLASIAITRQHWG